MAARTKPAPIKRQVRAVLDGLPDNCTIEDVHYQLYLIEKINRGEESLRRHGGIPHAEVRKRLAKWLGK